MKNKKTKMLVTTAAMVAIGAFYHLNVDSSSQEVRTLSEESKPTHILSETTASALVSKSTLQEQEMVAQNVVEHENPMYSMLEELFPEGDPAWAWAKVDLEAIRHDLPDNLYWTYGAPTKDPNLLALREESKAHWKAEFAKVLSNTATEQEIENYYAHQQAISTDYVEFATVLLNRHHQDLPERDYAMQTLARNLHLGRLEEIPGNLHSALERAKQHKQNQQAWLEDKESYEAELAKQRESALRDLGKI